MQPKMKATITTGFDSRGTYRGTIQLRESGDTVTRLRKTMLNDHESVAEALAEALTYFAQHMEPVLKACRYTVEVNVVTQASEDAA